MTFRTVRCAVGSHVVCLFLRRCSASSPTRLTYAYNPSRMARPHPSADRPILAWIGTYPVVTTRMAECERAVLDYFRFSEIPGRGLPAGARGRPDHPAR